MCGKDGGEGAGRVRGKWDGEGRKEGRLPHGVARETERGGRGKKRGDGWREGQVGIQ